MVREGTTVPSWMRGLGFSPGCKHYFLWEPAGLMCSVPNHIRALAVMLGSMVICLNYEPLPTFSNFFLFCLCCILVGVYQDWYCCHWWDSNLVSLAFVTITLPTVPQPLPPPPPGSIEINTIEAKFCQICLCFVFKKQQFDVPFR